MEGVAAGRGVETDKTWGKRKDDPKVYWGTPRSSLLQARAVLHLSIPSVVVVGLYLGCKLQRDDEDKEMNKMKYKFSGANCDTLPLCSKYGSHIQ
jgi:hypothetical protein